jgi:hypothetical protein
MINPATVQTEFNTLIAFTSIENTKILEKKMKRTCDPKDIDTT